ncbi:MAG TPA: glycosyltransferase family 2 protein, partial [Pirellulales bacterium]
MTPVKWLSNHRLAVVIPAFRTEQSIGQVVLTVPAFVSLIVVVDDCSPDATAEIVLQLSQEDSRVRLLRHAKNQGVGAAMMSGYSLACKLGAEVIVKMDGDGQMDPAQLAPLVAPILRGHADYSKGNRFLHSRQLHRMPIARRIGNLGLSFLTKIASGYWTVFDPT